MCDVLKNGIFVLFFGSTEFLKIVQQKLPGSFRRQNFMIDSLRSTTRRAEFRLRMPANNLIKVINV